MKRVRKDENKMNPWSALCLTHPLHSYPLTAPYLEGGSVDGHLMNDRLIPSWIYFFSSLLLFGMYILSALGIPESVLGNVRDERGTDYGLPTKMEKLC